MSSALPGRGPGAAVPALRDSLAAVGPCLVLLIGVAGAGKSTLARQLADSEDQVLSLDRLRAVVSGDECDQGSTADAVAALHLLAEARLRRGLATVVDATNVDASARRPLLDMARRHAMPAVAVVVDTPLATCLARNELRPGPRPGARWGRRVPAPVVRAQHRRLSGALSALAAEGFARVLVTRGAGG